MVKSIALMLAHAVYPSGGLVLRCGLVLVFLFGGLSCPFFTPTSHH